MARRSTSRPWKEITRIRSGQWGAVGGSGECGLNSAVSDFGFSDSGFPGEASRHAPQARVHGQSPAASGALGFLERAAAAREAALVVFTYHRIAEPSADRFYAPVISATPASFRAQVQWLRDHVPLLALDDLVAKLENGASWSGLAAIVTLDDGYRDNFDVALPILAENRVPATFFIPTGFLESPRLPWWDQVAYLIKETRARRLTLDRDENASAPPLVVDLEMTPPATAIMTIIRAFLDETIADHDWFLDQLAMQAEVAVDHENLGRALFMTWDHVRQVAASGPNLTIGSHAHSHRKLAKLDDDSQRFELAESKRILEAHIHREVTALAYPFGWEGTFTRVTKALAAEAGYCLAFGSRGNQPPGDARPL